MDARGRSKRTPDRETGGTATGRRRGAVRLPLLVTAAVVGYLLFSVSGQFAKLSKMEAQVRGMQQEVQTLQTKNQVLQNKLQLMQSDAYIEQMARKMGLVKRGEHPVLAVPQGGSGKKTN